MKQSARLLSLLLILASFAADAATEPPPPWAYGFKDPPPPGTAQVPDHPPTWCVRCLISGPASAGKGLELMMPVVAALSSNDMRDIAAYLASRRP